jgi:hypothetical protein
MGLCPRLASGTCVIDLCHRLVSETCIMDLCHRLVSETSVQDLYQGLMRLTESHFDIPLHTPKTSISALPTAMDLLSAQGALSMTFSMPYMARPAKTFAIRKLMYMSRQDVWSVLFKSKQSRSILLKHHGNHNDNRVTAQRAYQA